LAEFDDKIFSREAHNDAQPDGKPTMARNCSKACSNQSGFGNSSSRR
jgi:hypothetical protein